VLCCRNEVFVKEEFVRKLHEGLASIIVASAIILQLLSIHLFTDADIADEQKEKKLRQFHDS
jgi:hypothetical protein